jgi:hypothetical protein
MMWLVVMWLVACGAATLGYCVGFQLGRQRRLMIERGLRRGGRD